MLAPSHAIGQLPQSRFRVVGSDSTRSDLAERSEVKYALPGADVGKLRSLLESNCNRLIHNEAVSTVRSVYFDDPQLSACRANLAGIGQRRKLRLRWYDSLEPQCDFFFEIKWRKNRVTGKHRLQLQSDVPLRQLTYRQISASLERALPTEHLHSLITFCDPIVIVQYKREHFATPDGSLRVTIDYDITYYDQFARDGVYTSFGRHLDNFVVLEGKVPVGRESELRELLYPFAPRIGRCSKYVEGCRVFDHVRRGE